MSDAEEYFSASLSDGFFGPEIVARIYKPQLLADLTNFGISPDGLQINFDSVTPEGGKAMPYLDGWLGDFSEIYVHNAVGNNTGVGSISYVFSDDSKDAEPIVWWESFYKYVDDWVFPVAHFNFCIPDHVWIRMSPSARKHYELEDKGPAPNKYGPGSTDPDPKGWRRQGF